jgi:hypothetical protein
MPNKQTRKKLTRKRLNNALAAVYQTNPQYFSSEPKKMTFFEHVVAGNLDDVQEFLEEPDFSINKIDTNGNNCIWYAIDSQAGFKMLELLVQNGADINQINYRGNVPIHKLIMLIEGLTPDQFRMYHYLLDEGALLIPYHGKPIESVMDYKATEAQDEAQESVNHQGNVDEDLWRFAEKVSELTEKIDELSIDNVVRLSFRDQTNPEDHFYYVDLRMTGKQLMQYVKHFLFQNPLMNVRLLVGSKEINPSTTLAYQGINEDSVILIVIQLSSGFQARRGGKRKTHRRNRRS